MSNINEALEKMKKKKEELEAKIKKEVEDKKKKEEQLRQQAIEDENKRKARLEEKKKKQQTQSTEKTTEQTIEIEEKSSGKKKSEIKIEENLLNKLQLHPNIIALKKYAGETQNQSKDYSCNFDIISKNALSQNCFELFCKSKVEYKTLQQILCCGQELFTLKKESGDRIFICKKCKKEPVNFQNDQKVNFAFYKTRSETDCLLYSDKIEQNNKDRGNSIEVIWNYGTNPSAKVWLFDTSKEGFCIGNKEDDIHNNKGKISNILKGKNRVGSLLRDTISYINEIIRPNTELILQLIEKNPSIIISEQELKDLILKSLKNN